MSFRDAYLDPEIVGLPVTVSPRFSTQIVLAKSGDEGRNQNWNDPLRRIVLPSAVKDETIEAALSHWLIMGGPANTFPFRDPFDFASIPLDMPNVVPTTGGLDQALGEGDGFTAVFQMTKTRTLGDFSYTRGVFLPVVDTIDILIDGVAPALATGGPYTVESISRPGGLVTISPIPLAGRVLTWGGLFDLEVRWEADNTFDLAMHSYQANGTGAINLVEVRRC